MTGLCVSTGSGGSVCRATLQAGQERLQPTVRIPREFELPGTGAVMRKEGGRLVIEPARPLSLLAVLATLTPLNEESPPIGELDLESVEL